MSKRLNLATALHEAGAKPAVAPVAQPAPAAPVTPAKAVPAAPAAEKGQGRPAAKQQSRVGLRAVTVHISPEAHAQLAMLAIERGQQSQRKVTTLELMQEAINDLFQKYNRSRLA